MNESDDQVAPYSRGHALDSDDDSFQEQSHYGKRATSITQP